MGCSRTDSVVTMVVWAVDLEPWCCVLLMPSSGCGYDLCCGKKKRRGPTNVIFICANKCLSLGGVARVSQFLRFGIFFFFFGS